MRTTITRTTIITVSSVLLSIAGASPLSADRSVTPVLSISESNAAQPFTVAQRARSSAPPVSKTSWPAGGSDTMGWFAGGNTG